MVPERSPHTTPGLGQALPVRLAAAALARGPWEGRFLETGLQIDCKIQLKNFLNLLMRLFCGKDGTVGHTRIMGDRKGHPLLFYPGREMAIGRTIFHEFKLFGRVGVPAPHFPTHRARALTNPYHHALLQFLRVCGHAISLLKALACWRIPLHL